MNDKEEPISEYLRIAGVWGVFGFFALGVSALSASLPGCGLPLGLFGLMYLSIICSKLDGLRA